MARILPSDWRSVQVTGAAAREIETLALLEAALPDDLTVVHGVHWSRIQRGFAVVGEIDFVVLSPGGRILLIEQKSGFLEETPEGLVKNYGENRKHVGTQIDRTIDGLRTRLAPLVRGEPIVIDCLLYCPDYIVKNRAAGGIPDERIIDAPRRDSLPRRIKEALGEESLRPDLAKRLLDFFSSELELVPDTAALVGQADALVTRLAGGLATWARRLEFSPFRLRVTATAGSGKTLLALAILADAARAGRQALYVCYNRPLADHIAHVAPPGSTALTFHQLCEREVRKGGYTPDFSQDGAFDDLATRFANLTPNSDLAEELIIDEGQDFEAEWIRSLLQRTGKDARIWFMEDPMQQLYQRAPIDLQDFVTLRDDTNYRTPRKILRHPLARDASRRVLADPQIEVPAVTVQSRLGALDLQGSASLETPLGSSNPYCF